jgi:hypothetical protein
MYYFPDFPPAFSGIQADLKHNIDLPMVTQAVFSPFGEGKKSISGLKKNGDPEKIITDFSRIEDSARIFNTILGNAFFVNRKKNRQV